MGQWPWETQELCANVTANGADWPQQRPPLAMRLLHEVLRPKQRPQNLREIEMLKARFRDAPTL